MRNHLCFLSGCGLLGCIGTNCYSLIQNEIKFKVLTWLLRFYTAWAREFFFFSIHKRSFRQSQSYHKGWGMPEQGWRKGPWTPEEDKLLSEHVSLHGEGRWSSVARSAGLNRSGKSCRLRWVNYLRPGLKRGQLTPQEEGIIIELHAIWGNKWSTIARYLPGRTDNEIKNYWRTHFKKKEKSSQKQEKRKQQILKQKQQQQLQLQLQQQQQQQVQQPQEHGIKTVFSQAETSTEEMSETHGIRQQMVLKNPNSEDQCMPKMYQDFASWFDTIGDDGLPSGPWNFADDYTVAWMRQVCATN